MAKRKRRIPGGMTSGEYEMYQARGIAQVRGYNSAGRVDDEGQKMYDFLSIFHPEMSHAEKVRVVSEAHPESWAVQNYRRRQAAATSSGEGE